MQNIRQTNWRHKWGGGGQTSNILPNTSTMQNQFHLPHILKNSLPSQTLPLLNGARHSGANTKHKTHNNQQNAVKCNSKNKQRDISGHWTRPFFLPFSLLWFLYHHHLLIVMLLLEDENASPFLASLRELSKSSLIFNPHTRSHTPSPSVNGNIFPHLSPPPPEGKCILLNRLNQIMFALRDSPKQSGRQQKESSMDGWLTDAMWNDYSSWMIQNRICGKLNAKKSTRTHTGTHLLAARVKSLLASPAIWHCHRINQNAKHYSGTGKHKNEKQEKGTKKNWNEN